MVAQVSSIIGALILVGWLYWLTARVQNLLTLAETAATNAEKAAAAALRMASAAPPQAARGSEPATSPEPVRLEQHIASDSGSGSVLNEPPADDSTAARAASAEAAPSTAPMSAVIEAEKRAMIEREFAVHGEPHTFRFRTVGGREPTAGEKDS